MQLLETVSWRALGLLGLGAIVFVSSRATSPRSAPSVDAVSDVSPVVEPELDAEPIAHDVSREVAAMPIFFTFDAGGSRWVALAPAPARLHYKAARKVGKMYEAAVIATPVGSSTVDAWRDHELVVDGGCREKLESFALISRVSGAPMYADEPEDGWTTAAILEHGDRVIAAKLSRCTTGDFASTAQVPRLEPVVAPALAAAARRQMMASSFAGKAAEDWKAMGATTRWTDDASFDTLIARDVARQITWVSIHVHANGIGCGAPTTNFWGLFRVASNGALVRVALRALDNVGSLSALVDLDADGAPSLLGEGMLPAGPLVLDVSGEETDGDHVPYFGCPC